MEELFGLHMNSILIVMLALLGLSLLLVAFIAWRRPVIFKLGIRNIPRRKTQTSLIIVGLMLATLIMSAALSTGDTINTSVNDAVYDLLGPVDELVVASYDGSGDGSLDTMIMDTLPAESVETVRAVLADADVDAIGVGLITMGPVVNLGGDTPQGVLSPDEVLEAATASNPEVFIVGVPQSVYDDVGGMETIDGAVVDVTSLGANEVYISEEAADDLGLAPGDHLGYFLANQVHVARVRAIVPNSALAGGINPNSASMIVGMEHLQAVTGNEGRISTIFISNDGNAVEGLALSDEVSEILRDGIAHEGMGVVPVKEMNADNAEMTASIFVTAFVAFGLFSIAVGILLIVLIFTMLAAERRAEMGMERAVGAQRRQLVQQFIAEGAGYTLVSGIIGTTLGVGAAGLIAQGMGSLTGDAFSLDLSVHPRSLAIAYSLGVVITFLAVILSSWRVSKLNVVTAIRDIPEVYRARNQRSQLIWGALGVLAGVAMTLFAWGNGAVGPFLFGVTIIPFGLAAFAAYFGANTRVVLTVTGAFVLAWWLMPDSAFDALFGDRFTAGGMELFFLSGVSIVAASTLIIMQNMDALLAGVHALGKRNRRLLPSIRLGIAYPRANEGRAGMMIAMFSLIVFSIVVMGSVNSIISQAIMGEDANAGMQVRVDVPMANPLDDLTAALAAEGVDTSVLGTPGRIDLAGSLLDQQLIVSDDGRVEWESGYLVRSMDAAYLEETDLHFTAHADGYESDEAIHKALKTDPYVLVIPSYLATGANNQASYGFGAMPGVTYDEIPSEGSFAPHQIRLRGSDGMARTFTIIGVIDANYTSAFGYYIGTPTMDALIAPDEPRFVSYFMTVDDAADPSVVAAEIEHALLRYGVQGVDLIDELKQNQEQQSSFITVMQGFMGLGMIVGVAAVGVIAYRAVVERRQQIGMLRALGFQTRVVATAFVVETAVVVILGAGSGAILGLLVSRNLANDPATTGGVGGVAFEIPWVTLLVTVGVAVVAALVMSWFPARQASRILPAEALRYE